MGEPQQAAPEGPDGSAGRVSPPRNGIQPLANESLCGQTGSCHVLSAVACRLVSCHGRQSFKCWGGNKLNKVSAVGDRWRGEGRRVELGFPTRQLTLSRGRAMHAGHVQARGSKGDSECIGVISRICLLSRSLERTDDACMQVRMQVAGGGSCNQNNNRDGLSCSFSSLLFFFFGLFFFSNAVRI